MARSYKTHWDAKLQKKLKPIFNGAGGFVGWLEVCPTK